MSPDPDRPPLDAAGAAATISSARALSNSALIRRVRELAGAEQQITAALVAHLAVMDERQLYLVEGCSSMFVYLTQVLHFSEHAAYGRIQAARAARRYPVILDLLAGGSINLTTITLIAPELTARNHLEVLDAVRHRSRREVEAFLTRLRPHPQVRPLIRPLPAPPLSIAAPPEANGGSPAAPSAHLSPPTDRSAVGGSTPDPFLSMEGTTSPSPPSGTGREHSGNPRPTITPLAPAYYRVQFTASEETHAKLRAAQDLLRHQIPDGDVGRILDRALSALLIDLTRRKVGAGASRPERPSADEPAAASRHVPADVRRTVWTRDGGRCAFVAPGGRRCTERGFLEFHHVIPFSAGGPATIDNIELRCRAHNVYEAVHAPDEPHVPAEGLEPAPRDGVRGDVAVPPARPPS